MSEEINELIHKFDNIDKNNIVESINILSKLIEFYKNNNNIIKLSQYIDTVTIINPNIPNLLILANIYYENNLIFKSFFLYNQAIQQLILPQNANLINWSCVFTIIVCSKLINSNDSINILNNAFQNIINHNNYNQSYNEFVHSYIMLMNLIKYDCNIDARLNISKQWNNHIKPFYDSIQNHYQSLFKQRIHINHSKKNIGYLTTNIGPHAIFYFIYGMLLNHNLDKYNIYVYYETSKNKDDRITYMFNSLAPNIILKNIKDKNDETIASIIFHDKIDILIDIIGYTFKNKINVLLRKPAPVILTMIGYPVSYGLDVIDYKLFDRYTINHNTNEFTEKPLILQYGTQCYYNPLATYDINKRTKSDFIRFACFSFPGKFNQDFYNALATILLSIPNSIITFCYSHNSCNSIKEIIRSNLINRNIESNRVIIKTDNNKSIHDIYQTDIDISLDTYPYNGATTICDALWCGIPVITLCGDSYMSRMGFSILSCCGCPELVAHDWNEYIDLTVKLANDTNRLHNYHKTLHTKINNSYIGNPELFTKQFENALDTIMP